MNIAVLLHGGAGGSGVAATELGLSFARAGHRVHFVADRVPFRLTEPGVPNVSFHQVESMTYPLFDAPLTTLSEASRLAEVIEEAGIDVVHAHYAVPHATAAVLARDMVRGAQRPVVVTTLHGTDVTLVGLDRAYLRTTQYSIERSDLVIAVSRYLADYTNREMGVSSPIRVIPNAVDHQRFRPAGAAAATRRFRFAHPDEKLLVHISNFRPVKRVEDVIRVFEQVSGRIGARLLMVGDGPDRPAAVSLTADLGLTARVSFLGSFPRIEDVLAVSDLFLLPSVKESFGLSALEAMASGVPVVASRIGGLPEVVEDGETGILCAPGDVEGMARAALELLRDDAKHRAFAERARVSASARFSQERVVPMIARAYEDAVRNDTVSVSGK